MTDIVERLRQGSLNKDDYRWKAADEIEKLREKLETAYMYGHDMAKAEYRHAIQEVEGENDRLRAALEEIRDAGPMTLDDQRWRIALAALEVNQ